MPEAISHTVRETASYLAVTKTTFVEVEPHHFEQRSKIKETIAKHFWEFSENPIHREASPWGLARAGMDIHQLFRFIKVG